MAAQPTFSCTTDEFSVSGAGLGRNRNVIKASAELDVVAHDGARLLGHRPDRNRLMIFLGATHAPVSADHGDRLHARSPPPGAGPSADLSGLVPGRRYGRRVPHLSVAKKHTWHS